MTNSEDPELNSLSCILFYKCFTDCCSPEKSPEIPKKISVVHINKVLSDVYGSGSAASQQETIPLQQKLVMCSLLLLLKQGKLKEVTVGKVFICSSLTLSMLSKIFRSPIDFFFFFFFFFFFSCFPQICHFMQIVSVEMSNPVSWEKIMLYW